MTKKIFGESKPSKRMLATGIKNSILVFLIILILHFLIKNALFDRNMSMKGRFRDVKGKEAFSENNKINVGVVDVETTPHTNELSTKDSETKEDFKNVQKECVTSEDDELYKYVYGEDDGTDDAEISKYFKGMDVTKDVEENIQEKMKCTSLAQEQEKKQKYVAHVDVTKPISTTCDPSLQPSKPFELPVKANCNLDQNLPIMVLNQYDNESSMNGGDMFGLSAYDTLASAFESYECGHT